MDIIEQLIQKLDDETSLRDLKLAELKFQHDHYASRSDNGELFDHDYLGSINTGVEVTAAELTFIRTLKQHIQQLIHNEPTKPEEQ